MSLNQDLHFVLANPNDKPCHTKCLNGGRVECDRSDQRLAHIRNDIVTTLSPLNETPTSVYCSYPRRRAVSSSE